MSGLNGDFLEIIFLKSDGITFPASLFILNSRSSIYVKSKENPQNDSFNVIDFLYIKSIPFLSNFVLLVILILISISPLLVLFIIFPLFSMVIISSWSIPQGIFT